MSKSNYLTQIIFITGNYSTEKDNGTKGDDITIKKTHQEMFNIFSRTQTKTIENAINRGVEHNVLTIENKQLKLTEEGYKKYDKIKKKFNLKLSPEEKGMSFEEVLRLGYMPGVEKFLDSGIDIDEEIGGDSLVMHSILCHHFELAKILIIRGAKINMVDSRGNNLILVESINHNNISLVKFLFDNHEEKLKYQDPTDILVNSIIYGISQKIPKYLLTKQVFLDCINKQQRRGGNTILIKSIQHEKDKLLKFLIEKGCDVNLPDHSGRSPLMMSTFQYGTCFALETLLKSGANVNFLNKQDETALTYFCKNRFRNRPHGLDKKDKKVIEILITWGADLENVNNEGKTFLDYIECVDSKKIVEQIVKENVVNIKPGKK